MRPLRRNPKGRGFPGDLLCRAARPWGLPRASRRFAHLIPESLRRGHAGLIQRFRRRGDPMSSPHYPSLTWPWVGLILCLALLGQEYLFLAVGPNAPLTAYRIILMAVGVTSLGLILLPPWRLGHV